MILLEKLLQEMIAARYGKKTWLLILQRCLVRQDFDLHLDSYGEQRVTAPERKACGPEPGQKSCGGALLVHSAAGFLGSTVPGLMEELGRHRARGLRKNEFPHLAPASDADLGAAIIFICASCPWIPEIIASGSGPDPSDRQSARGILREEDLLAFLNGFLSEIRNRSARPGTTVPGGVPVSSLVGRNKPACLEQSPEEYLAVSK